ncbi:hypothetical protein QNO07_18985 [Streptomyces sp. 549]|uniref:hypothetical protein n=1 Tax=Streptomyces sp. 549 TaxID=3049076 RepID=UPI0024C30890|nr:hypothetical protein [Streptomyces sp. 549]MDK1475479.1 hypothetical protein [Streptomyces sp. 549]
MAQQANPLATSVEDTGSGAVASGGGSVDIAALVARSGDLKSELVEFVTGPKFSKPLTTKLREAAEEHGCLDDGSATLVIDHFALQHRSPDGRTPVERFVAERRPRLPDEERAMLLGWSDVVQGSFEVRRLDGDAVVLHNLMDDLEYRVYSNMGRGPFEGLDAGMFLVGRIVLVHPEVDSWLVSGSFAAYPAESAPEFAQAALQALTESPGLMGRNADKLRRSWELQAEARADFVDFFGSDLVVLPPVEAQESLREYHRRRLEKIPPAGVAGASIAGIPGASSPGPEELSQFPEELLAADSVAVLYDEVEGLGYYEDFGRLDELFANPSLARDRERLALLRGYLGDDTVSPAVIRRLVERHPEGVDEVFRALLRKPGFRWERDGDALLRTHKRDFFHADPMPTVTVVGDRLLELLRSGE